MNKILESLYDDPGYTITELANIMKMSRKSISNNIKNSELFILEKSGHCNYIFNNNDFYNKLNSFLKKH